MCRNLRGGGRTKKRVFGERLERKPSEGSESTVAVGVPPTVVDEHGRCKSNEVENDEERDDPSFLFTPRV